MDATGSEGPLLSSTMAFGLEEAHSLGLNGGLTDEQKMLEKTSDVAKKSRPSSPPAKKLSPVKVLYRKLRTPTPESTVLHVGCLTRNVNEAHLKEIFGIYGEVANVELAMDRNVGHSPVSLSHGLEAIA